MPSDRNSVSDESSRPCGQSILGTVENILWIEERKLVAAGCSPEVAEGIRHMVIRGLGKYHELTYVAAELRRLCGE